MNKYINFRKRYRCWVNCQYGSWWYLFGGNYDYQWIWNQRTKQMHNMPRRVIYLLFEIYHEIDYLSLAVGDWKACVPFLINSGSHCYFQYLQGIFHFFLLVHFVRDWIKYHVRFLSLLPKISFELKLLLKCVYANFSNNVWLWVLISSLWNSDDIRVQNYYSNGQYCFHMHSSSE